MKKLRWPIILFSSLLMLGVSGSWYVFVEGAPQLDPPEAEANTQLTFQVKSFQSQAMGSLRKYGLVLPPRYDPTGKTRYPVVILLHGGHGTERDYEDKAKLTSVLNDLYQAKKLPPAIVVTPDGNDQRGSSSFWDSEYFDGKNGAVGTLIGKELVQVIQSRYPTIASPQGWAIGGLSSGAWGAFNIGLRHTDRFRTFFSHTGYFTDRSGPENSPAQFIQKLPPKTLKQIHVYLDAGVNDHQYLKATQSFQKILAQLGVDHENHVFPGGHGIVGADVGWNYWHKHLHDSLTFVGKRFARLTVGPAHTHPASVKKSNKP